MSRRPPSILAALVAVALPAVALVAPWCASPRTADADPTYDNLVAQAYGWIVQAEKLLQEGDEGRGKGRAEQALKTLETACSLQPGDPKAAGLAVQACVLLKDLPRANEWLARYQLKSEYGEREPWLHYLRALVALRVEGLPQKAIHSLDRMFGINQHVGAAERDYLYFLAHVEYGELLAHGGHHDDAIQQFAAAAAVARRARNPRRVIEARAHVGIALGAADRWIEASEVFAALLKEDPGDPRWHWHFGLTLANQSKYAEALGPYRDTIKMLDAGVADPVSTARLREVHLRLGNCLQSLALGPIKPATKEVYLVEAEREIRRFIGFMPKSALGYKWLGVLLREARERPYEAIPLFEKAFALDPICDDALKNLVQIYKNYDPPPAADAAAAEKAKAEWNARLEAMEKDLADHREEREKARRDREDASGTKDNGCI